MNLGQLIDALKAVPDKSRTVPKGFKNPHSWRGIYAELAFEPADNVTIEAMLKDAESAIGPTFQGWKGGDYTYDRETPVHISKEGESYDYLGDYVAFYLSGVPLSEFCDDCWERYPGPAQQNHSKVQCLEKQLARAKEDEERRKALKLS